MKKYWLSLAVAAGFMFTACTEDRGTTTEIADADNTQEDIRLADQMSDYNQLDTISGVDATAQTEEMHRDKANQVASQISNDLDLDTATQTRVSDIYYQRSIKVGGLDESFRADTTGRFEEERTIENQTNNELRNTLSPEQYRKYEQNRGRYEQILFDTERDNTRTNTLENNTIQNNQNNTMQNQR